MPAARSGTLGTLDGTSEKPILPPVAAELWEQFARHANWSTLHQLDCERFYKFVVWTHRNCPRVNATDIRRLLDARGLPADFGDVKDLPVVYEWCRGVLRFARWSNPSLRWGPDAPQKYLEDLRHRSGLGPDDPIPL